MFCNPHLEHLQRYPDFAKKGLLLRACLKADRQKMRLKFFSGIRRLAAYSRLLAVRKRAVEPKQEKENV